MASEPQGMYLGNRYWHRDCIFMIYIILILVMSAQFLLQIFL